MVFVFVPWIVLLIFFIPDCGQRILLIPNTSMLNLSISCIMLWFSQVSNMLLTFHFPMCKIVGLGKLLCFYFRMAPPRGYSSHILVFCDLPRNRDCHVFVYLLFVHGKFLTASIYLIVRVLCSVLETQSQISGFFDFLNFIPLSYSLFNFVMRQSGGFLEHKFHSFVSLHL